jgi:hypothetical protein
MTLTSRRITFALVVAVVMTSVSFSLLSEYKPSALSEIFRALNTPALLVGFMVSGNPHSSSTVVIVVATALQWFGIGYLVSLLFWRRMNKALLGALCAALWYVGFVFLGEAAQGWSAWDETFIRFLALTVAAVGFVLIVFLGPARRQTSPTWSGAAFISFLTFVLVMEAPAAMTLFFSTAFFSCLTALLLILARPSTGT